ncbi:MAG: TlpA family protein disulfide reductase [Ketobacter sp.]|nr:MAG: TlpA family protein disulfide reductase [Ketobacter sp.]
MMLRSAFTVLCLAVVFLWKATAFAQPIPNFDLPLLDRAGTLSLADVKGKVVYLDFWASWCGPCAVSLPELEKLRRRFHPQGFEVVAINLDNSQEDARRFLRDKQISYPILFDRQQRTPEQFGVAGMPTAFLLDRQGRLRETHTGFKPGDTEKLTKMIQQLLQEEGS